MFEIIAFITLSVVIVITYTIKLIMPNLCMGTPRICSFILLLIVWVRSFRKILPSVKLAEDRVLVFVILREKMLK